MVQDKKLALNLSLAPSSKSLRQQFGLTLRNFGQQIPNLVVLDADLSSSTQTKIFAEQFPKRFFNVGIAEQNMVGIANGLATCGKIPVVSGFTCFTIGRAWEFIRTAAYDHLPLKVCTTHAGLSNGRDGGSHQAIEDLSLMAALPGTQIFCPCDPLEVEYSLSLMMKEPGVCYLRLMRDALPWVWQETIPFTPDLVILLYESKSNLVDITLFSTGSMSCYAPKVANMLEKLGHSVRVIHIGRIKPLDPLLLNPYFMNSRVCVTLEEHNIIAGFGAQLGRILAENHPLPLLTLGINDRFGQSGSVEELYHEYGLDPPQLVASICHFIQKHK